MSLPAFTTEDEVINWVLPRLRELGYRVILPDPAAPAPEVLTPIELRKQYAPHLSSGGLCKRLVHPQRPEFDCDRGDTGRIVRITLNPELIDWIQRPASGGRKLERAA